MVTEAGDRTTFSDSAEEIRRARTLTEDRFVAMGDGLAASIDILESLTRTFQTLEKQLASDSLREATDGISKAVAVVQTLSEAYRVEQETLGEIAALAAEVDKHIARMNMAVKRVDALGVNAKMEARHVSDTGGDFQAFADEIDSFLKLTQVNLAALGRDLAVVRHHIAESMTGSPGIDAQCTENLEVVPARLNASIESIDRHRHQASAAATAVTGQSQKISEQIGGAVMALQIGDITRQRIEHVEQALDRLDGTPAADGKPDGACREEEEEENGRSTVALVCRLLAAQLDDTAHELESEAARIFSSLKALTTAAGEIGRLGEQAYGASDAPEGAFLLELEGDVDNACALLREFQATRERIDGNVTSVWGAARDLADRIGAIHSLQADFRIMGLNTMLKCGRLGTAGKPLSVIAQELRECAHLTAIEADAIIGNLERMNALVAGLSEAEQERRARDIKTAAETMTGSVTLLGEAGQGLAAALAALRRHIEDVSGHLAGAVERITVQDDIGRVLGQVAERLGRLATDAGESVSGDPPSPRAELLLEDIAASYTMVQERDVHARVLGVAPPSASSGPTADPAAEAAAGDDPAGDDALADILF